MPSSSRYVSREWICGGVACAQEGSDEPQNFENAANEMATKRCVYEARANLSLDKFAVLFLNPISGRSLYQRMNRTVEDPAEHSANARRPPPTTRRELQEKTARGNDDKNVMCSASQCELMSQIRPEEVNPKKTTEIFVGC